MDKKGQVQLSFGMIFSIIIIVATLAVAGYITVKFLNTGTSVSCKLFYSDLQKKIDKAWYEDFTHDVFSANAPRGVKEVCFGNSTQVLLKSEDEE